MLAEQLWQGALTRSDDANDAIGDRVRLSTATVLLRVEECHKTRILKQI